MFHHTKRRRLNERGDQEASAVPEIPLPLAQQQYLQSRAHCMATRIQAFFRGQKIRESLKNWHLAQFGLSESSSDEEFFSILAMEI